MRVPLHVFAILIFLLLLFGMVPLWAQVVINEVDCDTPSTDTLEFVELYDGGTGNTALDGLVVVFYNGGDDASYDAFDLDGYSTDGNGYFLLGNSGVSPTPSITFGNGSLQNGADAVALYTGDATDFPNDTPVTTTNLLDAIVYDTNDADDAGLLVLLNAGQPQVNEDGAGDKDNHSNQRCPNGSGGARNTDTYIQATPTPGADNNCPPPVATNIIINEVDCDTPSTDTLEFVELYDGGTGNTALDGLVVVFYNGGDDASYNAFDLDGYSTDGNGYFLLGNSGVSPTPSITFGNGSLQNGADAVALYTGDAAAFPNDTSVTTTNLLDAIVYDTNDADDAGLLVLLNTGQPQVNEDGAGDKDNHSNQRCPNGSGGARNTDTYIQATPTPGADNNCPPPVATNIIINEVDCDTPSTDTLEFVELYDGGAGNTALDGLVVVFYNGGDDASYNAFDLDGYSTDGNGYFLLGNSGVSPTPSITFNDNGLQNGADAVAIYIGNATDFPDDTPVTTTNLLDAIVYDTNDADDPGLLVLLNAGQPQVNEDGAGDKDNHSNQRCPNSSGGQRNTGNYTQNTPTPGGANNCVNNPPTADAGPSQIVEVGDLVQLDASSSNDPDLGDTLSYSWSFTSKPSGSGAILSDPTAVNPTFTADEPGYYNLDLTVEDGHGGMDSDQVIVLAVYFLSPSPRNVVINEVAWMGTTYRFQDEWMELKNNTDLPIDLTGWQLVAGDIYPSIPLSGTIPPHSYFLLERTDDAPVSDIAADQVFIGVLNNPDAQQLFLLDPSYRVIDTANGDGGPWPAGTTVPIGRYTMERIDPLEPDSDANWGTNDGITQNGTDAGGNPIHGTPKACNSRFNSLPPVASFSFSPIKPRTNEITTFDASSSYDLDGLIVNYEWDWDNDGTFDQSSVSATITHSFGDAGTHTVSLTVTDNDGATDTTTQDVTVTVKGAVSGGSGCGYNHPPIPSAGPDQTVSVGEQVVLDGSRSYDPDEDIPETDTASAQIHPLYVHQERSHLEFQWAFATKYYMAGKPVLAIPDGSNVLATVQNFDTEYGTFVPDEPGEYVLNFTVTDDFGASLSDQVTITAVNPILATHDFPAGWNLLSIPLHPVSPRVDTIIKGTLLAHCQVFTYKMGYQRTERLSPTDGCWVYFANPEIISVSGRELDQDVMINLPDAGWHLVSSPYPICWSNVKVAINGRVLGLEEAVSKGVITPTCYYYEAEEREYKISDYLLPWEGYWVKSIQDDVSLLLKVVYAEPGGEFKRTSTNAGSSLPPTPPHFSTANLAVKVYPIPAWHSTVHFVLEGVANVERIRVSVYTASGRLVWTDEGAGTTLDWQDPCCANGDRLAQGPYIYRIDVLIDGRWELGGRSILFLAETD